jgi:two-component system LytT family response regulator
VDDEALARERLRSLLSAEPDVEIVGEQGDPRAAVADIKTLKPDLLLLDVHMPVLDGFGVVKSIPAEEMPVVIFVTAFDAYALQAFDAHAVDYLLKPLDDDRFRESIERARTQVQQRSRQEVGQHLLTMLRDLQSGGDQKHVQRLVVKSSGRVLFLRTDDIDWIEAAGNYLRLHVGQETHLLRETMNNIEKKLEPSKFLRIHRSTIVNVERVKELQPWFGGEYIVILRSGKQLTLSRTYRGRLQQFLDATA